MCINVACGADVTVTGPLLNLLQAHAVGVKQAGAAVAQVVEADAFHIVRGQMGVQAAGGNKKQHGLHSGQADSDFKKRRQGFTPQHGA